MFELEQRSCTAQCHRSFTIIAINRDDVMRVKSTSKYFQNWFSNSLHQSLLHILPHAPMNSTNHITPCWAPPIIRRLPKQTLKNFNWCPLRRNCRTLLKRCFFPLLGSRRCLSGINHFAHVQKDMLWGMIV